MSKRALKKIANDEKPAKSFKAEGNGDSPFSQSWHSSDAVLIVVDKELYVHTNILSIASKYFERMFHGNFVEAKTKRVTLELKQYEYMEHILRIVYNLTNRLEPKDLVCGACKPDDKKSVVEDNEVRKMNYLNGCQLCGLYFKKNEVERRYLVSYLSALEELSREYMFDVVAEKVRAEIIRRSKGFVGLTHVFDILEISEGHPKLSEAKENALNHIQKHLESYTSLKAFLATRDLSDDTLLKIKYSLLKKLMANWPEPGKYNRDGESKAEALALVENLNTSNFLEKS